MTKHMSGCLDEGPVRGSCASLKKGSMQEEVSFIE